MREPPPNFPIIHLMALGQALLKDEDPHQHLPWWRKDLAPPGAVIVGEFPGLGEAGLVWKWSGLEVPGEQIKVAGAFLVAQAQNLFLKNSLAKQAPALIMPGGDMMGMSGWRGN